MPHSIRVVAYWGDYDTLDELHLIGPYDTAEARDTALAKLAALPGSDGWATFESSNLDPQQAPSRMSAAAAAEAWLFRQLVNGFATNGIEVVCGTCGDDPERARYPECDCGTYSTRLQAELDEEDRQRGTGEDAAGWLFQALAT